MKKSLLPLILLLALLLTSCNRNKNDSLYSSATDTTAAADQSNESEAAPAKALLLADLNGTDYTMIVPNGCAESIRSAATDLRSAIYNITSKNVFVKTDKQTEEKRTEIVIGKTNRAENGGDLEAGEYIIKAVGDKLVIDGGSNYAIASGIKEFIEKHIINQKEKVEIKEDFLMTGKFTVNSYSEMTAGWNEGIYVDSAGTELRYQIYIPMNYSPDKNYSFILYMHSAGVRDTDNQHIYTGEARFLRNFEKSKYTDKTIILAPYVDRPDQWVDVPKWYNSQYSVNEIPASKKMNAVVELFNKTVNEAGVDKDRIYAYGMSMGGYAVWDLAARNPGVFAAIVPVAGCGDPTMIESYKDTAIWIFHGSKDEAVPYSAAQTMDKALSDAGIDHKFTTFEGAGHGIWTMTADTQGFLDWLFEQKSQNK